jgi:hypothetical protein
MPFIGAWMNRNAICPEVLNINGSLYYIRIISPTRVPQRSNFVDVY